MTQYLSNFDAKVEPIETYVDPVSKIRVSTPENLIDTDFEYGLQGTKWETLELVNNIPSFYVSDSDKPLSELVSVTAATGSNIITVTTLADHGLLQGSPIDVRGLSSRTAEGKFLIKSVPSDNVFTYISNGIQTFTGNIGNVYTTITPGNFYSGSQMPYSKEIGIGSDLEAPSTITVRTPYEHGHVIGTNVYLVNTYGTKKVTIDNPQGPGDDGRPQVDFEDLITKSVTPLNSKTETKQMRSTYYRKFVAADVNTTANTISWPNNQLRAGDALLYVPPSGDSVILGLARFQIYYVFNPTANTIQLSATRVSPAAINIDSTGTYNYGSAGLHLCYEISHIERTSTQTRLYHRSAYNTGEQPGWDWKLYNWGLGKTQPSKMALIAKNGASLDARITNRYYSTAVQATNPAAPTVEGMVMPEAYTTPGIWNFIEDFTRYEQAATFSPSVFAQNNNGIFFTDTAPFTTAYPVTAQTAQTYFFIPLVFDEERDSFYSAGHGFVNGQTVTITTPTGASILKSNSTTDFANQFVPTTFADGDASIEVISPDRFRIKNNRLVQATGTYTVTAYVENLANNSFFYKDHGYSGGELVVPDGTALPATSGGLVTLNPKTLNGNLDGAWTIINSYLNSYLSTLPNKQDMVLNGFEDSNIFVGSGVSSGTSGITSTYFDSLYISETGYNVVKNGDMFLNKQESGVVKDAAAGTILANRNFSFIGTGWVQDQTVPHYSVLFSTEVQGVPKRFEANLRTIFSNTSTPGTRTWTNRVHTIGLDTTNWKSSANFVWSTRSSAVNMVQMELVFWYEPWTADTNSFTPFGTPTGPRYISGLNNSGYLRLISTFMVNSGTPFTTTLADNLAQGIINDFATKFVQPLLVPLQPKRVKVINKDRFYLEDTATSLEVDIEDSGTGPLVFSQSGVQGVIDGAYTVSGIPTESSYIFQVPYKADETFTNINAASVSNNLINVPSGHSYIPGSRVVYKPGANTAIPGLTAETNYYTYIQDDVWIGFANSYEDAILGTLIPITAGTGTHSLASSSINARSSGAGTVNVVRGQKSITGTGTLFKRYYKVGDTIGLKDNSTTPGSITEFQVAAIADDNTLQLDTEPNFSATNTKYFIETKVYVRPDGYSVHRPFDGGVEISAGTSPNSQVLRQTRKYFRYQSGKGIQTSLAINFNPPVQFETLFSTGLVVTGKTRYPHRLTVNSAITVSGSTDETYNGNFVITEIVDDFSFKFNLATTPITTIPAGIIQFNMNGYTGSYTRAGMFDFQNGFFFEFDGKDIWCVRRSSTQQISGKVSVFNNESLIVGTDTNFRGQLVEGDMLVIRGGSYRVIKIRSNTELVVSPQYKGMTATDVIVTKTVDTKVKQSNWSIDKCDGSGPSGYNLNLNKIQMAYMDYSWYGAGKIRFGFKDTNGHVKYVHEFVHNNQMDEAYMRSGNLPARYEIANTSSFSYSPTLFHWGTSVIMDGRFDDDSAYLFTSTSNSLSYTNGQSLTATTNASSTLTSSRSQGETLTTYRVRLAFPVADASKFSTGTALYTDNGQLRGNDASGTYKHVVEYTQISGNTVYVYILVSKSTIAPAVYPVLASGTVVYIGAPSTATDTFNLGTDSIPLVTIRLAPSVDSGLSGALGAREIINRMQLILNEVGLILTHDCEVSLVLNGDLSNVEWQNVNAPSLSQLIKHNSGDRIVGGTNIFSFRAAGGTVDSTGVRLSNTSDFSLGELINMGNSILGGNGTFPNGPDILTVVLKVVSTAGINATNKFVASGRITWSESQA